MLRWSDEERRSNIFLFFTFLAATACIAIPFAGFLLLDIDKDTIPKFHSVYAGIMLSFFGLLLALFGSLTLMGLVFCIPSTITICYAALIMEVVKRELREVTIDVKELEAL